MTLHLQHTPNTANASRHTAERWSIGSHVLPGAAPDRDTRVCPVAPHTQRRGRDTAGPRSAPGGLYGAATPAAGTSPGKRDGGGECNLLHRVAKHTPIRRSHRGLGDLFVEIVVWIVTLVGEGMGWGGRSRDQALASFAGIDAPA
ncbi:hypothetical protein LTR53_017145 [Teratosphaeriaceae sp. CCFEE 6253]|nr:hypothetical protein LTR53_017145 [Teratosphaeriaceae sp. CCFEE 6253]